MADDAGGQHDVARPAAGAAEADEYPAPRRVTLRCSILQGESLEEISKLLDGHPHFHSPNASVEVREFLSMPGMS